MSMIMEINAGRNKQFVRLLLNEPVQQTVLNMLDEFSQSYWSSQLWN
jgi:hypothetical protein